MAELTLRQRYILVSNVLPTEYLDRHVNSDEGTKVLTAECVPLEFVAGQNSGSMRMLYAILRTGSVGLSGDSPDRQRLTGFTAAKPLPGFPAAMLGKPGSGFAAQFKVRHYQSNERFANIATLANSASEIPSKAI